MNNLSCFVPSWFALNLDGFSCLKKNLSGIVLLTKPKVNVYCWVFSNGIVYDYEVFVFGTFRWQALLDASTARKEQLLKSQEKYKKVSDHSGSHYTHTDLHFASLHFTLLCFASLCFALLCFALLCFALLCFALLCFALLHFALFYIISLFPALLLRTFFILY